MGDVHQEAVVAHSQSAETPSAAAAFAPSSFSATSPAYNDRRRSFSNRRDKPRFWNHSRSILARPVVVCANNLPVRTLLDQGGGRIESVCNVRTSTSAENPSGLAPIHVSDWLPETQLAADERGIFSAGKHTSGGTCFRAEALLSFTQEFSLVAAQRARASFAAEVEDDSRQESLASLAKNPRSTFAGCRSRCGSESCPLPCFGSPVILGLKCQGTRLLPARKDTQSHSTRDQSKAKASPREQRRRSGGNEDGFPQLATIKQAGSDKRPVYAPLPENDKALVLASELVRGLVLELPLFGVGTRQAVGECSEASGGPYRIAIEKGFPPKPAQLFGGRVLGLGKTLRCTVRPATGKSVFRLEKVVAALSGEFESSARCLRPLIDRAADGDGSSRLAVDGDECRIAPNQVVARHAEAVAKSWGTARRAAARRREKWVFPSPGAPTSSTGGKAIAVPATAESATARSIRAMTSTKPGHSSRSFARRSGVTSSATTRWRRGSSPASARSRSSRVSSSLEAPAKGITVSSKMWPPGWPSLSCFSSAGLSKIASDGPRGGASS